MIVKELHLYLRISETYYTYRTLKVEESIIRNTTIEKGEWNKLLCAETEEQKNNTRIAGKKTLGALLLKCSNMDRDGNKLMGLCMSSTASTSYCSLDIMDNAMEEEYIVTANNRKTGKRC